VTVTTRVLLVTAGALIAIAGIVWTLQGLGHVTGSFMTGAPLWAIICHRRGATRPDRARPAHARPRMIAGSVIATGGMFWLSRIPSTVITSPGCSGR
jgi:hypothetical protein